MRSLFLTLLLVHSLIVEASLQIIPGGTWTTAHGGGLIQMNSTCYLVGEDKTSGSAFQKVNCYSSLDLVQWNYVGALLSKTSSIKDLGDNRVIERPKVIYNGKTKKYVLWMYIDSSDYGEAKLGIATGDTVCGKGCLQLLGDDDRKGYLLSEDRENGLRIVSLSDDCLTVSTNTYLWPDHIEAPALVKIDNRYYMFGSKLTDWDPNDNVYSTSAWKTFADSGSKPYPSQTNYVLETGDNSAVYLGDRWVSNNLMASTYIWLPLTVSGESLSMKNAVSWVPNLPGALYEGKARPVSCSTRSNKTAAGYIGGSEQGQRNIRRDPKRHRRSDNGDPSSNSLTVSLKKGSENTMTVEGWQEGCGPDLDRVMVPVS
ncbi:glycosyl hydrolase [Xylariales sp. AK1849]|nr:glycosyl hydrolase [Xylariales sp. AK1849]